MPHFESRRSFALGLPGIAGKLMLDRLGVPEYPRSVTRSGTFTAFGPDSYMDQIIANRFGLNAEYFINPIVRHDISQIKYLDELWSLNYWSEPLIQTPSMFEHMKTRLSDSVILYLLQNICDENKQRPFFIAPDTFNFFNTDPEQFIGSLAGVKTWHQLDYNGHMLRFGQPKSFSAFIIDVRDPKHHREAEAMLADADTSTIATITNAHWDHDLRWFRSKSGRVIPRIPEVEITIYRT